MNPDVLTQLRIWLAAIGGFAVAKYGLDESIVVSSIGLLMVVLPSVWGWLSNRPNSKEAVQIAERVAISDEPNAKTVVMASTPPPGVGERRMF